MELVVYLTIDFAFKLTVGNPQHPAITIHFLNSLLSDENAVDDVLFLNPTIERDAATRKLSQLDIRLQDDRGRQINIEMQNTASRHLRQRLTFYASRLFVGQIDRGEDYRLLRPSIGIWLLNRPISSLPRELHLEFGLRTAAGAPLSDDLRIHLLQLPFQTADEHNVATRSRLEQWAFFLRHAHQYDQRQIARILPDPVFQEAKEVLTMISRDPKKRIDYEWRLKQRLDENYLRAEAADEGRMQGREEGLAEGIVQGRSEGLEQGLEKGLEQGLEKGRWIGQISVLEQVLKLPASPLSDLQTWPVEQLAARAEELTRKLASDSR